MTDAPETERLDDLEGEPRDVEAELEELDDAGDQSGALDAAPLDDVELLRRELEETVGKWQRAQADYQNLKRRMNSDLELRLRRTMEPLLRSLLLVLDHLDMALMSPTESQDAKNLAIGVEMVRKQMVTALEESEVERIDDQGSFDPELHQAIGEVASEAHAPGTIVETIRAGYSWRGQALRHAEVRVAADPGESTLDQSSGGGQES